LKNSAIKGQSWKGVNYVDESWNNTTAEDRLLMCEVDTATEAYDNE